MGIAQECYGLYWTNPGSNIPQNVHLPPISKTIQIKQTRHAGHCLSSKVELVRDVLLWTPSHGRVGVGRPRTYLQQLCVDTGYSLEDLPEVMDDKDEWQESRKSVLAARHDDDDD